jgi:uncharacterized protein
MIGRVTAPRLLTRAVDGLVGRLLGVPPPRTRYARTTVSVPMRDGVALAADHYAPAVARPLGTVLLRTPYARGSLQDVASVRVLAARGYHVLVQSCRGVYGSGGEFDPMVAEVDDGRDTVAWLRRQPWFDGRLGTIGASYAGWTQWAIMVDPPPELRASVVVVAPHDFAEAVYGTGAFTLLDFLGWSDLVAHQEDVGQLRGVLRAATGARRRAPAYAALPLGEAAEPVLDGRAPWYREWVAHHDRDDPFWAPRRLPGALAAASAPVLLVGGWQDLFIDQTLEQYTALHDRGAPVALTVGPWTHLDVAGRAAGTIAREALAWFDEHLAGVPAPPTARSAPVRVHVTGAREWRDLPAWPPPTAPHVLHLRPGGGLGATAPPPGQVARFCYDPADPTPTLGGRLLSDRAGVLDDRPLEAREDVVVFTSEPLAGDVEVVGRPAVELDHASGNPHADVFARLCDVDPRGRSLLVTDMLVRLDPRRGPGPVRLDLTACAHRFRAGHRLRLVVAGGSHPRFARHTGTGEPPVDATTLVPAEHVLHGGRLTLPTT